MGRLEGKVAVILGASDERSMGFATARRFIEEGAHVILSARREDHVQALADRLGAQAKACDITVEADLSALADEAVSTFGRLDIAVNLSGVNVSGSILDVTEQDLRRSSDIHFIGAVLFMKHMARRMQDGGSIILTSSLTVLAQAPDHAAYAGAKGGADVAVKIAANELGSRNIRVNAIAPGFTKSAMTEEYFSNEDIIKAFIKEIPLGRFPTVEDYAETALWLSSDAAFVTGMRIEVTGGQALRRVPLPIDFA